MAAQPLGNRGGDFVAKCCPRLGLDEGETQMVIWLVRNHLLMSDVAQKRDISDPTTVREFARDVQIPERLRLLLVLTVCDIRGVGPGVWNNWKAQLLRNLYWDTRDMLTGGAEQSRTHRIDRARGDLSEALAKWPEEDRAQELTRHYPHYWLGLETDSHVKFAEMARRPAEGVTIRFLDDPDRDATVALLYLQDHPGIFSRMAGAFALAGASVVDARTYTTADGMACSSFSIQDAEGSPFDETRLPRLKRTISRALKGEVILRDSLREKASRRARKPFTVPTRIKFDNEVSDLYTVIEVDARDRLGLLHDLTRTLSAMNINIFCAIIATYGEQAVDVFYVRDLFGLKITSGSKQAQIEKRLVAAIARQQPSKGQKAPDERQAHPHAARLCNRRRLDHGQPDLGLSAGHHDRGAAGGWPRGRGIFRRLSPAQHVPAVLCRGRLQHGLHPAFLETVGGRGAGRGHQIRRRGPGTAGHRFDRADPGRTTGDALVCLGAGKRVRGGQRTHRSGDCLLAGLFPLYHLHLAGSAVLGHPERVRPVCRGRCGAGAVECCVDRGDGGGLYARPRYGANPGLGCVRRRFGAACPGGAWPRAVWGWCCACAFRVSAPICAVLSALEFLRRWLAE